MSGGYRGGGGPDQREGRVSIYIYIYFFFFFLLNHHRGNPPFFLTKFVR